MKREISIVAVLTFVFAAVFGGLRSTSFDNYAYLGDALLHGRVWADNPPGLLSTVLYHGQNYIVEPPMPGILMVPFCLFWHERANQTLLSVLLLAIGTAALWSFLRRLSLSIVQSAFVVCVSLFATAFFNGGAEGDVWELANVSAEAFTFLLFNEVAGRNRSWLVAMFAVSAGLSRYALLPLLLVYAVFGRIRFGWPYALRYSRVAIEGYVLYALYNFARWGLPYDIGYKLYQTVDMHQDRPIFGLQYFPMQFHSLFLSPPDFVSGYFMPIADKFGIGMLYTGLVFVFAFFAPRTRATAALWICALVAMAPSLLYYNTGDQQYGQRHEMDFVPFLVALLALTIRARKWLAIYVVGAANVFTGLVWMFVYAGMYER